MRRVQHDKRLRGKAVQADPGLKASTTRFQTLIAKRMNSALNLNLVSELVPLRRVRHAPLHRAVLFALGVGAEVQADCICIVYLCLPVCGIEGGGGASSTPRLESAVL